MRLFQPPHHASQRLNQRRILITNRRRNLIHIPLNDAGRDTNVLGVRSVVEQQIFTEILKPALAVIAIKTRSRVGGHDTLARTETLHIFAHRDDIAGQLMAEQSRRNNHSGVISATKHLHIRAARKRSPHTYQNIAPIDLRYRNRLYFQMLLPVEDGSHHLSFHEVHLCG
jgi:hypothetical protein